MRIPGKSRAFVDPTVADSKQILYPTKSDYLLDIPNLEQLSDTRLTTHDLLVIRDYRILRPSPEIKRLNRRSI